ncbi:tRNA lysidine(34) synthetase TilS [Candidatus Gracilibacteria bacterium]|nr:tRNA lysidine(34) synthetase TilS [Candidatus Gracilibacteria bacterium]
MKILVAVSGGIDSVVLLDLLAKNKLGKFVDSEIPKIEKITIAHFNHKIHTKADDHQKFVEKLTKKYSLEFFTEKSRKKLRSEAEAREARYRFLGRIARKIGAERIALAHHAGDQVETIFLNLIRGSGLAGLGGMQEFSKSPIHKETNLWRPLLEIPKSNIENYAKRTKLKWIVDPTNIETKYSRNFLREEVLPKLKKLNPKFSEAILRTSKLARENSEFTKLLTVEWLRQFEKNKSVGFTTFNSLPSALKREVIREIYSKETGNLRGIEEKHVEEILALARNPHGKKEKKLGKVIFKTAKQDEIRVLKWK